MFGKRAADAGDAPAAPIVAFMLPQTLRPRTVTELVDAGFAMVRDQYAMLVAATAIIVLPAVLLRAALGPGIGFLVLNAVENLLYTVADGAVVLIVSERLSGRRPDLGAALRLTLARSGTLVVSAILRNLAIGLGLLLLIVPGLFAIALFFAMPMIVMIEHKGVSDASDRSRELARGHVLRILGVLGIGFVMLVVFVLVGGYLVGLLGLGERGLDVVSSVLLVTAYPMPSVLATLLYYDLRIRKEGLDLEILAARLPDAAGAPAVPRA